MSNNDKKNIEPKLRFPEFLKSEKWVENTIGNISSNITAGATPSTTESKYWGGDIRWMNSGELNLKKVYEVQGRITQLGLKNSSTKILPKKCVLVGLAGQGKTRGTVAMNLVELCTNQSIAAIHPNKSVFSSDFLYHSLDGRYDELRRISAGDGGRGGLNLQIIKKLKIHFPQDKKEQQKIADCLSSMDELITGHARKLEALQSYKKGLMQNLFPAEGETTPKLRLPEFQNALGWKIKSLNEVANFFNGRAYKQAELLEKGKYKVLRVGNFFSNKEWYYSDLELEETKYCNYGDLLYAWSASFGPRIWHGGKTIYHYHIWKVEEKKGVNKDFLYLVLDFETERMKSQSANGLGLLHITKSTIEAWKCGFPEPEEQKRIADFLYNLDRLITEQSQKVEALKAHKKGLMQQLFPTMSEL